MATVDGREVLFDFDNFPTLTEGERAHPCVFKFHTQEGMPDNVHAFWPVTFFNWPQYEKLADQVTYIASGSWVSSRQRCHYGAKERRERVQRLLADNLPAVRTEIIGQAQYWGEAAACLCAVFVPGARNDMLDRAMGQYMALGCCCVAPPLLTLLPWNERLVPGEHYVVCRPDYGDLLDVIAWCDLHRKRCVEIGRAAKDLFLRAGHPRAVWSWVRECLTT